MKFFDTKILKAMDITTLAAISIFMSLLPEYLDSLEKGINLIAPQVVKEQRAFLSAGRLLQKQIGGLFNGKEKSGK